MRKNEVIANQEKILANQEQIKQNQDKLDLVLASQETILAKQEQISQLEAKLSELLSDQSSLLDEPEPLGEMIGASAAFQQVLQDALNVAATDTTVLLRGETGTGKELLAHALHAHSPRRHRPFIIVNCAALPAALIESELFGYEKGAFTGAAQRKAGRFELADGGTLLLDEIGEVPLEMQGRFLRVLQTGIFERLGSTKSIRVKVRLIAATNQPLEQLVSAGKFRADLFYRLNVFPITLPPLRARPADIPLLVRHFVNKFSARFKRPIASLNAESMRQLQSYHWPGNVRELEHLVERAVLSADGEALTIKLPAINLEPAISINDMPSNNMSSGNMSSGNMSSGNMSSGSLLASNAPPPRLVTLADHERAYLLQVLRHTRGRISGPRGAAEILGLPASTLRSRMKKLKLELSSDNDSL